MRPQLANQAWAASQPARPARSLLTWFSQPVGQLVASGPARQPASQSSSQASSQLANLVLPASRPANQLGQLGNPMSSCLLEVGNEEAACERNFAKKASSESSRVTTRQVRRLGFGRSLARLPYTYTRPNLPTSQLGQSSWPVGRVWGSELRALLFRSIRSTCSLPPPSPDPALYTNNISSDHNISSKLREGGEIECKPWV